MLEQDVIGQLVVPRLPVDEAEVEDDLVLQVEALLAHGTVHPGRGQLEGVLVHVHREVVQPDLLEGPPDVVHRLLLVVAQLFVMRG